MKFTTAVAGLTGLLASTALAAPSSTIEKRASFCGQWDSATTGTYTLYNDLWNEAQGTGSQCTGITALSGSTLSWYSDWSWSGGSNQVKSYANAYLNYSIKTLAAISSIKTTWKWG